MTTASSEYKQTGIRRLSQYIDSFAVTASDPSFLKDFVNLFCEYQLADNNYMDIHLQGGANSNKDEWFTTLTTDQVLRYITYIIWTDKFSEGFLFSKVEDKTLYKLLSRLQQIQLS
jgi:hypothetical protein